MNNIDRGIIKWQPFESLTSSKEIVQSLVLEKSKIAKPLLSEDEIRQIEEKIIEAYYSSENINISYFKNGFINNIKAQIIKIDHVYKMVYLSNNMKLFFKQIIAVKF